MKQMKTYYSAILISAAMLLSLVVFQENAKVVSTANVPTDLRNEKAIEHLKQTDSFDSLAEAYQAARYNVEQNGATISAENPANQMQAQFDESGNFRLSGTAQNWQTVFRLKTFGRGAEQTEIGDGSWQTNGNRAELRCDEIGLTEYFENRADGLEQGFILEAKPAGDENLSLILQTDGNLEASASADRQKIILSDATGAEVLSYDKLKVWDASGKDLTARMTTDESGEIHFEVEDANAVYPLTIDPTFVQRQKLAASDGASGDLFGASVAISGNTAVIGAPENDFNNNQNQGAAYVFVLDGINWSQQARLIANDGSADNYFGQSVSISGDTVVVGAYGNAGTKGAAYVFVRSNANWSPQEKLVASDGVAGDVFGNSVSISGETVIVGANGDDIGANTNQGSAYVYVRSGGVWSFQKKLTVMFGTANSQFGNSLSLTGGTVIIGAYTETVGGNTEQGAAYVFTRSGTTWTQQVRLTASDGSANDNFGNSVDLSLTVSGAIAVVGADNDNIAGNAAQGSVYVFNRSQAGTWTQTQKLINVDGFPDHRFGSSVAITPTSAANIFIGGHLNSPVLVFKRVSSVWNEQQRIPRRYTPNFGSSIAVSGETVIIGSKDEYTTAGNSFAGAAYIFKFGGSPFDFDGDDKTDISIFRPSNGQWWINRSSDTQTQAFTFGANGDRIMPGDFTGDGKTDIAFYRPVNFPNNNWYILRSETYTFYAFPFGNSTDLPTVGDFDGDGRADQAVFRPSTATWYIQNAYVQTTILQFGQTGDVPAVADYDGDGKSDIAIFRPNGANGAEWWYLKSATNQVTALQFGISTDKPVQGDFTGDGKADIAVWRPSNGNWFILRSEDFSFYSFPFGTSGDVPAPGDYDGDGKFDAAVFRPTNTTWYVNRSTAGTLIQQFGIAGDKPVPNAFVP
ncbi:hypothetical protein BH10ACI1_BH10ACI1_23230 [soil metagenome]